MAGEVLSIYIPPWPAQHHFRGGQASRAPTRAVDMNCVQYSAKQISAHRVTQQQDLSVAIFIEWFDNLYRPPQGVAHELLEIIYHFSNASRKL